MKLFKSIPELYQALESDPMLPKSLLPGVSNWQINNSSWLTPGNKVQIMVIGDIADNSRKLFNVLFNDFINIKVYFTDIVKQFAPNNRQPSTDEISFYLPYIFQEIDLVSPKLIITCGQLAYAAITGRSDDIDTVRGKVIQLYKYNILPIYHPRDLLDDIGNIGGMRWLTEMDLAKVGGSING